MLTIGKALKARVELDADLRQLIGELRDTLTQVQECRKASGMPGADRTVQSVVRLVLEIASLIDEWLRVPPLSQWLLSFPALLPV